MTDTPAPAPTDDNPLGSVTDHTGKVWIDATAPAPKGWRRTGIRWPVDQIEPVPTTKRVPLHKVIGERLPSYPDHIINKNLWLNDSGWRFLVQGVSWCDLPVDDDGTVEVLA